MAGGSRVWRRERGIIREESGGANIFALVRLTAQREEAHQQQAAEL